MIRLVLIAVALLALPAMAAPLEDCILANMRGVSSDAAARMVKQACEQKVRAASQQRLQQTYGEPLFDRLEHQWVETTPTGIRLSVTNNLGATIKYLEVKAAPADPGGFCPFRFKHVFVYSLKQKPGANVRVEVPLPGLTQGGRICTVVTAMYGTAPTWSDISIDSTVHPMSRPDLDKMNKDLGKSFGEPEPPFQHLR